MHRIEAFSISSAWQLKDKNFLFGSQDDIILGRNEMVPICPFLDLAAFTCLVGKYSIAELQSSFLEEGIILQVGKLRHLI